MSSFINELQTRPLPVRRRIATAAAGALALVIAFVWGTANIALGTFGGARAAATPANSNLAGAAAAIPAPADEDSSAGLTIVETDSSSTVKPAPGQQTVIPF
jgi:hypothetical protein